MQKLSMELTPAAQIYIVHMATLVYEIFEDHTDEGTTSDEGLFMMQNVMDEIPENWRGSVFESFLSKLQEKGIKYDTEMFEERVVH